MTSPYRFASALCLCFALLTLPVLAQNWKPIDPEHLAMKAPKVEKEADAEAIFWEVRVNVDENSSDTQFQNYIRIKVFTDRGKESQSTIELPYLDSWRISDISGRTIKPDGTILELKKDAVFDRVAVKFGRRKVKVKSFAMPGVEPGVLIEYRWKETKPTYFHTKLEFQRELPIQLVKYAVKPAPRYDDSGNPLSLSVLPFRCQPSPLQKEKDGYQSITLSNVPAFREEPNMPPEDEVRSWMLLYYSKQQKNEPEKFWKEYGRRMFDRYKGGMKVNDEVRRAATEAIGDASAPEQKLERLLTYCRTKIRNIYDDAAGLTEADLKKMKENKSASDTIKRGYGDPENIDLLFAALASAIGMEARVVEISDRGRKFFDSTFADSYFMDYSVVAVKVGTDWKFFDPSSAYTPFGMLKWRQEGIAALVTDPKEPVFVETPLSAPEKSVELATGKLKLSDDGTLEGDVSIKFSGHLGARMKEDNDEETPEKREEMLRNLVKSRMSTAELSNIRIENVTDPVKPFIYSFHVKVQNYATRTGKRLIVQPAFFQFGDPAKFPNAERRHAVYFEFPYLEESLVEIELPEGYALDNAEAPAPFNANDVVKYDVSLSTSKDSKTLIYTRRLRVNGMIFQVAHYKSLKQIFDLLHQQDNHTVSLKVSQASASAKPE